MSGLGLSLGLNRGSVLEPFDLLDLNPLLYFDARTSMLNAGGTQAGFLESVATLTDLAGSAVTTESVVDRRPTAMPLIDGKGYLYTSGVTGNYAEFDAAILPSSSDFDVSVKFVVATVGGYQTLLAQFPSYVDGRCLFRVNPNGEVSFFVGGGTGMILLGGNVTAGTVHTARVTRTGNDYELYFDGTSVDTGVNTVGPIQSDTRVGDGHAVSSHQLRGAVLSVTVDSDVSCDFTTGGQHGASSFVTSTGQTVTINKTGLDPSLLLRRPVLRFDGASTGGDRMRGTLGVNTDTTHSFLKFAVNGDTFADTAPRAFVTYKYGKEDWLPESANIFTGSSIPEQARSYFNSGSRLAQNGWWDDDNGTIVVEVSITNGTQFSKVNNANEVTDTQSLPVYYPDRIVLGHSTLANAGEAPMDLEQIILFDRVVDESDANDLYNHIK